MGEGFEFREADREGEKVQSEGGGATILANKMAWEQRQNAARGEKEQKRMKEQAGISKKVDCLGRAAQALAKKTDGTPRSNRNRKPSRPKP